MSTRGLMIAVSGLRKSYGSLTVLDGIDLSVGEGEIFALLGPNGAGKTTTVNILTTLVDADSGSALVAGIDVSRRPRKVRDVISLTGQYASVDHFQTGEENLVMMSRLAHLGTRGSQERSAELLEQFGLVDAARRRVSTYSGGMRRRLDLAISLIARPPVVFLDEPTTGLDPRSRAQMWSVVRELARGGTTILLTTQYLEEADQLADSIAVIDDGRVVAAGTAAELKTSIKGEHIALTFDDQRSVDCALRLGLGERAPDADSLTVLVPTEAPVATIRGLLSVADENGLAVSGIAIEKPTLDDVFLALTGGTEPSREEIAA